MKVRTEAEALVIAEAALRGHPDASDLPYTVERDPEGNWMVLTHKRIKNGVTLATAVMIDSETGRELVGGYQQTTIDGEL